jgi:hypothetical protein
VPEASTESVPPASTGSVAPVVPAEPATQPAAAEPAVGPAELPAGPASPE